MKKLILLGFALFFSVSSTFAYRIFAYGQIEGISWYECRYFGGSCLPTVVVEEEEIASIEDATNVETPQNSKLA
jgi:hypothetical protein